MEKFDDDDDEHLGITIAEQAEDKYLYFLHGIIRFALRILAFLMALVVLWGVADVVWLLYLTLLKEPKFLLEINDMFETFGAFLAVLIGIEIFVNIVLYLKENVIHVRLVVATALMAISRKIIVFDYAYIEPMFVFASAATVFALGITYYLFLLHLKTK
ncbi:MAG: hypothetical protein Tsb0021_17960 [Chlamydiales bacterium]